MVQRWSRGVGAEEVGAEEVGEVQVQRWCRVAGAKVVQRWCRGGAEVVQRFREVFVWRWWCFDF